MSDKIITLYPKSLDDMPQKIVEDIRVQRRDEMLEFLQGMIGRVEAFEITGISAFAFSETQNNDIVFNSSGMHDDPARTAGCMSFVHHDFIAEVRDGVED